jgi:DNA-binding response OmpR family regulator
VATILVVDDESGIREFIADALSDVGHQVSQAGDAKEAMRRLEDRPFDLVVLDLNMPGDGGGLDVLRRARAEWPEMQAIVLTAHGTVETAVEAMRMGAFDFLQKPISGPEELRRLVGRALNWRGASGARRAEALRPAPVDDPAPPPPRSRMGRLLWELKRRHVYNVAATYLAVSFILLQAAQLLLPALPLPDGTYTVLVALAIAGFPVAIAFGWVYDITAKGLRRSAPVPPPDEDTR